MFTKWFRMAHPDSVMQLRRATGLPVNACKQILEGAEPDLHAKIVDAMESQSDSQLFHDPIEDDPTFAEILAAAADLELSDRPRGIGFCHQYWAVKKRILKEQYDVNWLTPREMNPWITFD